MRWKLLLAIALLATTSTVYAQQMMTVTVKNHRFQPSQLTAPANAPISIRVRNQDSTRMDFESVSLRGVMASSKFVRLPPAATISWMTSTRQRKARSS